MLIGKLRKAEVITIEDVDKLIDARIDNIEPGDEAKLAKVLGYERTSEIMNYVKPDRNKKEPGYKLEDLLEEGILNSSQYDRAKKRFEDMTISPKTAQKLGDIKGIGPKTIQKIAAYSGQVDTEPISDDTGVKILDQGKVRINEVDGRFKEKVKHINIEVASGALKFKGFIVGTKNTIGFKMYKNNMIALIDMKGKPMEISDSQYLATTNFLLKQIKRAVAVLLKNS